MPWALEALFMHKCSRDSAGNVFQCLIRYYARTAIDQVGHLVGWLGAS